MLQFDSNVTVDSAASAASANSAPSSKTNSQ